MHTPAIIAAHLHLVDKLAMPVLTWCDHGHTWATGFGLAWATLLLIWPVALPTIVCVAAISVAEATDRRAMRRQRYVHLRLRSR